MPTSEFEKKIHRWASLICCFGSYRCLVGVGSICNLLELDLQMPGQGWKHLQFAGIGFVDTYKGEFRTWKYLQFASIEFADAYHQVDIKNPTTIAVGLFFYVEKSKMFLHTNGTYCAKI